MKKLDSAETTRLLKATPRKQFPTCKFSVTHGAEQVAWTDDGPTQVEVEAAIIATRLVEIQHGYDNKHYLRLPTGHGNIWFDRYNAIERAAEQQDQERRQAEWQQKQRAQAERAAEARRAVLLPGSFWHAEDIPPIPLLRQLNNFVIRQNEKRLPKWKFKFADDLAVRIQSQVTRAHELLFKCVALQLDKVSAKPFLEPSSLRGQRYWRVGFKIFANEPDAGTRTLKPTSTARDRTCPASGLAELRKRVVAPLHPDRLAGLHLDLMLSPHCLCCGKALTDPVSMARWIGPECWGSASTNLPRIFRATPCSLVHP